MRIWYLGLIPRDSLSEGYYRSMEEHARAVGSDGTRVEFHVLDPDVYKGGHSPAKFTRQIAGEFVEIAAMSQMVLEAERQGCDAVVIGTLQEPGLGLLRTLTDMPVVGYGQAASLVGRCVGSQIGILAFNEDLFPVFRKRLNSHAAEVVGPILGIDVTYDELHSAFSSDKESGDLRSKVEEGLRELIARGASVLVAGQMLLTEVTWRLGIRRVGDVPVLDGLGAVIMLGEGLVRLRQTSGLEVCRRGFDWSKAEGAVVDALDGLRTS